MQPVAAAGTGDEGSRPAPAAAVVAEAAPAEPATTEETALESAAAEVEPATVELDAIPPVVELPATALEATPPAKLTVPVELPPASPRPRYRGMVVGFVLAIVFTLGWLAARWLG
ncbi:MAG: hypothetical protein JRI68_16805 [Deltaproteobacteria bacterium]|nr:hypothetical protein [Deltaproteobacteria bacterium]